MSKEKREFTYLLTINELDTNTKMKVKYTQKGALLWDWLARCGYVSLIPYDGCGYFYWFKNLKAGMKKAYKEGLIKKGGLFYEERYY